MVRAAQSPYRSPSLVALSLLCALSAVTPLRARAQAACADAQCGGYAELVRKVAPSVVTLVVESDVTRLPGFFGRTYGGVARGGGSGVVVAASGLILTNHHVVEHAVRIDVELEDGRSVKARVLGIDPATDLAVVQAELSGLPVARFADSRAVRPGDRVIAIGAPFGLRHTVTAGVISAVDRKRSLHGVITEYLQTDARINPGNSGGPLVNLRGEVVGINTAILGERTSIGFSIPANVAREVSEQLIKAGVVARGYLGIRAQEIDRRLAQYFKLASTRGALINRVDKGSPAARAGIVPGDIALSYDASTLADANDLLARIARSQPGQTVKLGLWRQGKSLSVALQIQAKSAAAREAGADAKPVDDPLLGLKLRTLTAELRQESGYDGAGSVIISGVVPGSPAERVGLEPGLAVLEADLRAVAKPRDLLDAVGDGRALLRVENDEGETAYVLVQSD